MARRIVCNFVRFSKGQFGIRGSRSQVLVEVDAHHSSSILHTMAALLCGHSVPSGVHVNTRPTNPGDFSRWEIVELEGEQWHCQTYELLETERREGFLC